MNTTYFKNLIMGNIYGTDKSEPIPSKYFLGLSSTLPSADGSNVTEVNSAESGYKRVELTSLGKPLNGVISNEDVIEFGESLSNWFPASSPATHYVVYDAQEGGNLLMYNELKNSRVIEANTLISIKPSSLYFQLTD